MSPWQVYVGIHCGSGSPPVVARTMDIRLSRQPLQGPDRLFLRVVAGAAKFFCSFMKKGVARPRGSP